MSTQESNRSKVHLLLLAALLGFSACQESVGPPAKQQPSADVLAVDPAGNEGPLKPGQGRLEALREAQADLLGNRVLDAVVALDAAVSKYPDDPMLAMTLGQALLRESQDQDVEEALSWFQTAAKMGLEPARVWSARTLVELGRLEDAVDVLHGFLAEHKNSVLPILADAHFLLAKARLELGQTDDVAENLGKARIQADAFVSHQDPGRQPLDVRRLNEILRNCDILNVEWLLAKENFAGARSAAEQLVGRLPETPWVRELYATALEANGEQEAAARQKEAARLLAEVEEETGVLRIPLEQVEAKLDELEQLSPVSPRLPILRIRLYMARSEYADAMRQCRAFRATGIDNSRLIGEAWFLEGQCLLRAGQYEDALQCFANAAEAMPGFRPEYERIKAQTKAQLSGNDFD